jgi:hypothetical protein
MSKQAQVNDGTTTNKTHVNHYALQLLLATFASGLFTGGQCMKLAGGAGIADVMRGSYDAGIVGVAHWHGG